MKPLIEVCAAGLEVAIAAEQAGADRIELNVALELDGLTPSAGLVQRVCDSVRLPVIAMLRPRPGNFVYSRAEWEVMESDFQFLLKTEVAGVAFGVLDRKGHIVRERVQRLRELADREREGFELVFHRAFDSCSEPDAIEILADLGVIRVMTSGGGSSAEEGVDEIRKVVSASNGRIEVIPAAGINARNVEEILKTGCGQAHGTFGTRNSTEPVDAIRDVVKAAHAVANGVENQENG